MFALPFFSVQLILLFSHLFSANCAMELWYFSSLFFFFLPSEVSENYAFKTEYRVVESGWVDFKWKSSLCSLANNNNIDPIALSSLRMGIDNKKFQQKNRKWNRLSCSNCSKLSKFPMTNHFLTVSAAASHPKRRRQHFYTKFNLVTRRAVVKVPRSSALTAKHLEIQFKYKYYWFHYVFLFVAFFFSSCRVDAPLCWFKKNFYHHKMKFHRAKGSSFIKSDMMCRCRMSTEIHLNPR